MKNGIINKIIVTIAIILFLYCAITPIIIGDSKTKIGCYPSSDVVTVGETFNVTVWLSPDEPIDS